MRRRGSGFMSDAHEKDFGRSQLAIPQAADRYRCFPALLSGAGRFTTSLARARAHAHAVDWTARGKRECGFGKPCAQHDFSGGIHLLAVCCLILWGAAAAASWLGLGSFVTPFLSL